MRSMLLVLTMALATPALAAEPAATPASLSAARLSIDTKLAVLASDERTAEVLKKRMPGFVERMLSDEDFRGMFAGITLRELALDPHARGFAPGVLEKLDAELAAAQAAPAPSS